MMDFIRPRLRKPLGYAVAGTALAVAWAVRGSPSWFWAVVVEAGVLVIAITTYLRGAQDTDEGALAGSRADERQILLSLRARTLGWAFAMITAFIGLLVGISVKASWWLPFLVILAAGGFGNLFGWSTYGTADEGPGDDAHDSYEARSPTT
jgi:hypothetical protein